MKKPRRMNDHMESPPSPRRRRLLAFLGLAAGTAAVPRGEAHPACLLSLKEADFYSRNDLAG